MSHPHLQWVGHLADYQPLLESMGVWFTKCWQPVSDLPVARQSFKCACTVVVVVTVFPRGLGMSSGMISLTSP